MNIDYSHTIEEDEPEEDITSSEIRPGNIAADIIRHVLFKQGQGRLFTTSDLTKILSQYPKSTKKSKEDILNQVNAHLVEYFGIRLVEVPRLDREPDISGEKTETKKPHAAPSFALVSTLSRQDLNKLGPPENASLYGIVFVVLSIIFLFGGPILEDDFWYYLSFLGLDPKEEDEQLGNVNQLITSDLVQMRYLQRSRVTAEIGAMSSHTATPATSTGSFEYRWGSRALVEIDVNELLNFIAINILEDEKVSPSAQTLIDALYRQ
ncbi:putative MAGE family protein [Blattamonas nauphoetae]|uniref:MAGE family protein n=1 Tax=Blattamonas nauphoetae TaxID=2049346 RepID=A0ABQ9YMQ9_9EUKA|nr:putative MAGE family protein [Blattamonas nauphoetae]